MKQKWLVQPRLATVAHVLSRGNWSALQFPHKAIDVSLSRMLRATVYAIQRLDDWLRTLISIYLAFQLLLAFDRSLLRATELFVDRLPAVLSDYEVTNSVTCRVTH